MQSKLIIDKTSESNIETIYYFHTEETTQQLCVMSTSRVRNRIRKLCLASHTPAPDGMEVVNYAFLEVGDNIREKVPLLGVFCGQRGQREQRKGQREIDTTMAAESLVFMKEDKKTSFTPERLTPEIIKKLIHSKNGEPYKQMLIELFKAYGIREKSFPSTTLAYSSPEKWAEKGKRERFLCHLMNLYREIFPKK